MIRCKTSKSILCFVVLAGILLASSIMSARPTYAQGKSSAPTLSPTPASGKPAVESTQQSELTEAQTNNEKAQAQYYHAQASEPLWQKLAELGTFLAAIIALLTFAVNYRAGQRNHRDTQFYQALAWLGDDNPAIRAGAVSLLAQMARDRVFGWRGMAGGFIGFQRPFYDLVLDRLVSTSLMEKDLVVFSSIKDSVASLARTNPIRVTTRLYDANRVLQRQMVNKSARLFAMVGISSSEEISDEQWARASAVSGYDVRVLQDLVYRPINQDMFGDALLSSLKSSKDSLLEKQQEGQPDLHHELRMIAARLRENVELMVAVLRESRSRNRAFPNVFLACADLTGCFLRGANLMQSQIQLSNLSDAQLQGANLTEAVLRGTTALNARMQGATLFGAQLQAATLAGTQFQNADLRNANVQGACLRNSNLADARLFHITYDVEAFEGAKWWKANFASDNPIYIDKKLLTALWEKYKDELPEDLNDVHRSIRDYIPKGPNKTLE